MDDNITNSIRKFILHFILITEVVGFTLTIGAAILFYKMFLEMDSDQLEIAICATLTTSFFTLIFAIFSDMRRLRPIQKFLFITEKGIADKEIILKAQKSIFRLPLFHSVEIGLRILITASVVITILGRFVVLDATDYYNLYAITLLMSLLMGVYTFLATEKLTSNLIDSGIFKNIDVSSLVKIRLTGSLTITFIFIMCILAITISCLVFKFNHLAIQKSYFNQMENTNETLSIFYGIDLRGSSIRRAKIEKKFLIPFSNRESQSGRNSEIFRNTFRSFSKIRIHFAYQTGKSVLEGFHRHRNTFQRSRSQRF